MTLNEWIKQMQALAEEKGGDIEVRSEESDGEPWAYFESEVYPNTEHEVLYIG